jgi:hypothetical protein
MLRTTSVSYIQSPPTPMAYLSSQSSSSSDDEGYYFALAGVKGEIHLVQSMFTDIHNTHTRLTRLPSPVSLSTPPSAMTLIDIKIFKHELATIFRHVQTTTMHPSDVRVMQRIEDDSVRYEEDRGTAFLAKEIVEQMRKFSMAATRMTSAAEKRHSRYHLPTQYAAYGSFYWQSRRMNQNGKV